MSRRQLREVIHLGLILLVIFGFRSAIIDWYEIPTGSMKPTIIEGDRVFVNKLAYDLRIPFTNFYLASWSNPQRGEIVVFNSPVDGHRLIKRVVGVPGDVIELNENVLYINGVNAGYRLYSRDLLQLYWPEEEREERDLYQESFDEHPHLIAVQNSPDYGSSYGPIRIEEGHYFMMGDNRDSSADSRIIGAVPRELILGRAIRVFYSLEYPGRSFSKLDQ